MNKQEEIIQFGEGGFLRGFFDWMVQKMHTQNLYDKKVVVVQPIEKGLCETLESQNCKYHHVLRGKEGIDVTEIDIISRCVNPFKDTNSYFSLASQKELKIIVSNTTEAGIAFSGDDKEENFPYVSFPAKLTLLLKKRFDLNYPGFTFFPCELIPHNGEKLKESIIKYANLWNYPKDFITWLNEENTFTSTLVDRINTGFPFGDEIIKEYPNDKMLNTSEHYHLWVIECEKDVSNVLPLSEAGIHVIYTKNSLDEYRTRKVRILNGIHTSLVCFGLLTGFETVRSCLEDENMNKYIKTCVFDEIIPTLSGNKEELVSFANDVLNRFSNPYINHMLKSISLNSISKFKERVLPSILAYKDIFGKYPKTLTFGFAKLIEYYKTKEPTDDAKVIDYIKENDIHSILSNVEFWGGDISNPAFEEMINKAIKTYNWNSYEN